MVREPFYVGRLLVYEQGMGAYKRNMIVEIKKGPILVSVGAYYPDFMVLWYAPIKNRDIIYYFISETDNVSCLNSFMYIHDMAFIFIYKMDGVYHFYK